jgi:hypothetical protein
MADASGVIRPSRPFCPPPPPHRRRAAAHAFRRFWRCTRNSATHRRFRLRGRDRSRPAVARFGGHPARDGRPSSRQPAMRRWRGVVPNARHGRLSCSSCTSMLMNHGASLVSGTVYSFTWMHRTDRMVENPADKRLKSLLLQSTAPPLPSPYPPNFVSFVRFVVRCIQHGVGVIGQIGRIGRIPPSPRLLRAGGQIRPIRRRPRAEAR